jgi:4-amino-4-deoxy-L-arabinose transferase-like glycosyltransferase
MWAGSVNSPEPGASSRAFVVLAFVLLACLYFYRIGDAPVYLAHDEAMFGVVAHEIGWHLRDVDGQFFPVFMRMSGVYWNMPAHPYFTALAVRLLGTTETVIRGSSAAASLLAVFLIYVFCRRVFRHRGFAAIAAAMFALSPAFFMDSRLSTDHHYPLIALALWLICLERSISAPNPRSADIWLGAAGLSLGAGVYTYAASVVLMPIYVALTVLLLVRLQIRRARAYAALGAAFSIAVLPFAIFLLTHPGYIGDVATNYKIYDARRFGPLQGAHEIVSWTSLSARSDVYFSYFNPSMLFFSGAGSLVQSTRQAGFFLAPFIVLLPGAVIYVVRRKTEWFAWLSLAALAATPLAASIVDEHGAVQRVLALAPFAAIVVVYTLKHVSTDSRAWVRFGTWALVLLLPISFVRFYSDYLGDYRVRSSGYFEQNIRGALQAAIEDAQARPGDTGVCLSRGINPLVDWYWKFYLLKNHAESLSSRVTYFDGPSDVMTKCQTAAVVVTEIAACDRVAAIRGGRRQAIVEPNGSPSFCVFSGN